MKKTIIPLFLVFFIFSAAVSAEPTAEQLLNADFEDWTDNDLDNWTVAGSGTVENETTEKHLGSYSVKVNLPVSSWVNIYQEVSGFTEGNSVTGVVYALEDYNSVYVEVDFIWYDDFGGSVISATAITFSVDDANWQEVSGSQNVPTGANVLRASFYCANDGSTAVSVYIDAASISGPDVDEFKVPTSVLTASAFMVVLAVIIKKKT